MKRLKQRLCAMLVCVLCIALCACQAAPAAEQVRIPDIERTDADTAKTILTEKGLIPKLAYEYSNAYEVDMVIRTEPPIGSEVAKDTPVTLYVCRGMSEYGLQSVVGRLSDIDGVEPFTAGDTPDGTETKGYYDLWVDKETLYIPLYLKCVSAYELAFYDDFGVASLTDTFAETIPVEVIYDSETIDNQGAQTDFTVVVPLGDFSEPHPASIYIRVDVLVNGEPKVFQAEFDLVW